MKEKKKKWTTTKLITTGSLGVLYLILALLGAGIVAVTGIPLTGGVINVLITPIMTMICLLVVRQLGSATTMLTVYAVLAIPFPLAGTPGFLGKVPIFLLGGIIIDLLYLFLKRNKKVGSLVIGGLGELYFGMAVIEVGQLFNVPGVDKSADLFYSPTGIGFASVLGAVGGYLGYLIYQKIKNTAVVKRIQS
jgi:hypothetical protein